MIINNDENNEERVISEEEAPNAPVDEVLDNQSEVTVDESGEGDPEINDPDANDPVAMPPAEIAEDCPPCKRGLHHGWPRSLIWRRSLWLLFYY